MYAAQQLSQRSFYLVSWKSAKKCGCNVSQLDQLNELMLVGCDITDAGLVHLRELPDLRDLYLNATGVTARGVAELESALPDCTIYSDFSSDQIPRARHEAGASPE